MPYKGQRKRIDPTQEHGFIGQKSTKKATPIPWVERASITEYKIDRDNHMLSDLFICEETKLAILEKRK